MAFKMSLLKLEKPTLNLISVDCPVGLRLLLATVHFQVWARADSLDEFTHGKRLATMSGSSLKNPATAGAISERQSALYPEQEQFMRYTPIISHPHLRLDPDQAGLEAKSPRLDDGEGFLKERVGRPQVQVRVLRR